MKFSVLSLFALVASATAFTPVKPAAKTWVSARTPVMSAQGPMVDVKKMVPALLASAPVFAADTTDIISQMPMATSLEVTFAAYLAVILGTFLPCLFLVILYLNSEARITGKFEQFDDQASFFVAALA